MRRFIIFISITLLVLGGIHPDIKINTDVHSDQELSISACGSEDGYEEECLLLDNQKIIALLETDHFAQQSTSTILSNESLDNIYVEKFSNKYRFNYFNQKSLDNFVVKRE